jgi:hypothetical protein
LIELLQQKENEIDINVAVWATIFKIPFRFLVLGKKFISH